MSEETTAPCCVCTYPVRLDLAMTTKDGRPYHMSCPDPERPDDEYHHLKEDIKKAVKVPATDFGNSGVTRHICDNDTCRKPLKLTWKGRNGEYCSNECLKIAEGIGDKTMTEATETESSPITAGASNKKGKASAKKAAPKKTTTAAKAATNGHFDLEHVIKVLKPDALRGYEVRGKRRDALNVLKDGMTIEKFRDAMGKKDLKTHVGWALNTALEEKLISIKKP